MALEQLYLLTEIETVYRVNQQLLSGLERWIIRESEEKFRQTRDEKLISEIALDILEWAPMESKVLSQSLTNHFLLFTNLAVKILIVYIWIAVLKEWFPAI